MSVPFFLLIHFDIIICFSILILDDIVTTHHITGRRSVVYATHFQKMGLTSGLFPLSHNEARASSSLSDATVIFFFSTQDLKIGHGHL
jgi:hypothetical protein